MSTCSRPPSARMSPELLADLGADAIVNLLGEMCNGYKKAKEQVGVETPPVPDGFSNMILWYFKHVVKEEDVEKRAYLFKQFVVFTAVVSALGGHATHVIRMAEDFQFDMDEKHDTVLGRLSFREIGERFD